MDLRFMGGLRFPVYAAHRIAHTRRYRGRISYLEVTRNRPTCDDAEYPCGGPSDMLPASWMTREDDFICVYVLNLPFVDSATRLAPDCAAGDGALWLLIVRKEAGKLDLLEMFAAVEEGRHTRMENVDMVKILAFRLEPLDPADGGHVTVDGELVDYAAVQGRVLPSAGRFMVAGNGKKCSEEEEDTKL